MLGIACCGIAGQPRKGFENPAEGLPHNKETYGVAGITDIARYT
jgi:hypothetical protein